MPEEGLLRIGELGKRAGVKPELLRAWERRYGLLQPTRSAGGLRLYSSEDVERVRTMQRHLADGLAAAEAAALAARPSAARDTSGPAFAPDSVRAELAEALDRIDEPRAQQILDQLLATTSLDVLLRDVVLPYLEELGERWERGEVTVGQEHFAASVIRGRLLGLARGWGLGIGPTAVLACLPAEQHDLGLIAFGLALRARGWRIVYLGTDAPLDTIEDMAQWLDPELIVLSAVTRERVDPVLDRLRTLAGRQRVALGGAAARDESLESDGLILLTDDLVADAVNVTAEAT